VFRPHARLVVGWRWGSARTGRHCGDTAPGDALLLWGDDLGAGHWEVTMICLMIIDCFAADECHPIMPRRRPVPCASGAIDTPARQRMPLCHE